MSHRNWCEKDMLGEKDTNTSASTQGNHKEKGKLPLMNEENQENAGKNPTGTSANQSRRWSR